jgi:xylulokinase
MDESSVSRYLVFDLETMDWNPQLVAQYELKDSWLPEILPWGSVIGEVRDDIAEDWDMPLGVILAQGCHDSNSSALGAGVFELGTACLVSGSYENVLVPTDQLPTNSMLLRGLSVMPHPCRAGLSVFAVHPTGNAVLNWARDQVNLSIEQVEEYLQASEKGPGPVLGIPYLSGSMTYWENGRKARGGLLNLTLATNSVHIVQAFMESIAYDLVNTLSLMREERIEVKQIRITGGGSRSKWWTQLKADLTNMPIEVVKHPEPGTLGAALLAGLAIGIYDDIEVVSRKYSGTKENYVPDPDRAALHMDRLETYRTTMRMLLEKVY